MYDGSRRKGMAQLIHPSSARFNGPFLIDRERLVEFDQMIGREWEELEKWYEDQVQQEVVRRKSGESYYADKSDEEVRDSVLESYQFSRRTRDVTVKCKKDKELRGNSFQEIARLPEAAELMPVGFTVTLERGPLTATIKSVSWFDETRLEIDVNPNCPHAQGLKSTLEDWATRVSAPAWQRVWLKVTSFLPFLQWMPAILFLIVFLGALPNSDAARDVALREYQVQLCKDAHELLADGVNSEEVARAVELELALSTNYLPPTYALPGVPVFRWPALAFILSVVFGVISSLRPRLHIGLGRGEAAIRRWKLWLRFSFYKVPVLLLSSVVIPLILSRIR
jgi:hypothetical protein